MKISNMTILISDVNPKRLEWGIFRLKFRHFWVFWENVVIRRNLGCWFHLSQYWFQVPAQKYANQAFLVPSLRISILSPTFATKLILGCCFQIWQWFLTLLLKTPKKAILVSNLRIFVFSLNFPFWKMRNYFLYDKRIFFYLYLFLWIWA